MDLPAAPYADALPALALAPPAADGSSSSASPPLKRRRAAPVLADCCRTCRLRKVKCSGNPGHGPCTNCARLELACSFIVADEDEDAAVSRTTPSHSHTEAGTLRKRAQRACSQCHSHKTKCSGDLPRCKRCEAGNLSCEYTPAKRRFTNVRFQSSPTPTEPNLSAPASAVDKSPDDDVVSPPLSIVGADGASALLLDPSSLVADELLARRDLILRHVDAYMHNLYWLPCQGFFNPETLYREIEQGTVDPIQAAGICSLASFFVNPTESGREFGLKCNNHLELYLFQNVNKLSDQLLVIFALNITYNVIQGSFAKVWQCFGVASRLMLGLRINWDVQPRGRTFAQQECLRRIGWHLFHIDRMLAGGYDEYISCRAEIMKIPLPCDEAAFRGSRPVVAERLYDKPGNFPRTINMHAFQVRLVDLRHRIQVTTKRLCSASGASLAHVDASKIMADINSLQNELTRFHASLPTDVLLSDQSVSRYMALPERPGYVFLHCHLAGSHVDLYRYFLPGQKEKIPVEILRRLPREFIARSQKQAVAHSMSFGRFCDAIQDEVEQIKGTGRLELAGDYSTIQLGTSCVRVLLVALQHHLYRDITQETTAPLWRMGTVDESHMRFLIQSIQRMTEPWRDILTIAQQAYEHNRALVDEYDRTNRVNDGHAAGRASRPRTADQGRLPGPNSLLESVADGNMEDFQTTIGKDSHGSDRWLRTGQMPPAPQPDAPNGGAAIQPGTPGIPILLEQARSPSLDASDAVEEYVGSGSMVGLDDMPGALLLRDANPLALPSSMPMLPVNGGIDPAMYQQAPPVTGPPPALAPMPNLMVPQHGIYGGYPCQYAAGQGEPAGYGS